MSVTKQTIHWLDRWAKSFAACVGATLFSVIATGVVGLILHVPWNVGTLTDFSSDISFLPVTCFAAAIITFIYIIVVGLPVQFVLQLLRLNGWRIFLLLGSVAGYAMSALLTDFIVNFDIDEEAERAALNYLEIWPELLAGSLLGASCTYIAWLIRRPDKDVEAKKG